MRNAVLATLATVSLAAAGAWMRIETPLKLQPESRLWVDGTSTTRSFTCKAAVLDAEVVATDAAAAAAILKGEKVVRKVTVTVPAPRLDCSNGTMNDHMRKAIKAEQHKAITFVMTGYDVARAADGARGTINGSLTLGGTTRTISLAAAARDAGNGQIRVAGTHDLKLSDYGLKAPSLMFGAMKVGDAVTVGFDIVLKPAPPAAVP